MKLKTRHYRFRFCLAVVSLGLSLLAADGWAYFFDYGAGVRPCGMGRAFVAVADDANAVNWNPAGLVLMDRYEITSMYASLFSGFEGRLFTGQRDSLGYSFISAAIPVNPEIGYFGASWSQFNSYFYRENTFNIGYARSLKYETETLHVGANLKILNWSVDANDYTEALSKTGFTADLAVLYPLPEKFVVGMCLENLIPTDVGVTTYEEVPCIFRLGVSWSHDLKPINSVVDDILLSAELVNRNYAQNKNTVRFGAESWFLNGLIAARTGVNSTEFTVGFSGQYTFPQLNMTRLKIDYAFALPFYIQKTYGTHRLALTASWSQRPEPKPTPAPTAMIAPEENLAAKREQELAEQRARDEARLKAMVDKLRMEIQQVRTELNQVDELIKLGKAPPIQFQSGKATLTRRSFKTMDQIGAILEKYLQIKVRLEGHTDSVGKAKYNQRLSQRRVESVKEYLAGRFKLNSFNLIPVGFGETRPIASNKSTKGRATNRRVEFKVLIPAGIVTSTTAPRQEKGAAETITPTAKPGPAAADLVREQISPEDIIRYDDLERLREKLKVYEMQLKPDEIEKMFEQQHRQNNKQPPPAETL